MEDEVRASQLGELGFFDKRGLRKVVESANGEPQDLPPLVTLDQALEHGIAHVFERASVVPQHRILEAALVKGRGQLPLDQLKRKLAADDNLVGVGTELSTRDILTKELFLIRTVNAGHVLISSDRFTGFRGLAGSGKSTTLLELARVLQREATPCLFCAPTASATDTLRKDLKSVGQEPMTIAKLLSDSATQRSLSNRSVLVVDEAAAVGLDDMRKIFELALLKDTRVILSGDTGQHAAVARGDALRIIEEYSRYRFAELKDIRRQKAKTFRQIVRLAADKQTGQAFTKLLQLGAVTEATTDDGQLYQRAADAYLSATKQGKSALLVSPTWAEIEAVTDKVREVLKAEGLVGQAEEAVSVFDSFSWTEAQRKNPGQFESGQKIRFVRATRDFGKGQSAEVIGIDQSAPGPSMLGVRRSDGSKVSLNPSRWAASFDVGQARELKVARGDWLLLQANHGQEFVNGERVQIRDIQNGRIALTDGRQLPPGFNTFTHGYAITSHSSQGKTADEVLLVASSRSFAAVNREQFYVSISRGRERVHVFTDDVDLLARRVIASHERKAAVELCGLREELTKLGFVSTGRQIEGDPAAQNGLGSRQNSRCRTIRPLRQTRTNRLAPIQRLIQTVAELVRWLSDKFGVEARQQVQPSGMMTEQLRKLNPPLRKHQNTPSDHQANVCPVTPFASSKCNHLSFRQFTL